MSNHTRLVWVKFKSIQAIHRANTVLFPEISGDFSKDLLARFRYASEDEDSIFVEDAKSAKRLDRNQRQESLLGTFRNITI